MHHSSEGDQNQATRLKDPEPVSFALGVFAALSGAAAVIIQGVQYFTEKKHHRAVVLKNIFTADRSLNRIDESYRSLISIFDEYGCLHAPFALGQRPIFVDEDRFSEIDRLQSNIFYGGRDLQKALTELASLIREEDSELAMKICHTLDEAFQRARHSDKLLQFMIELGIMLEMITEFLYRIGKRYKFQPTSPRTNLIQDTIQQLRRLEK